MRSWGEQDDIRGAGQASQGLKDRRWWLLSQDCNGLLILAAEPADGHLRRPPLGCCQGLMALTTPTLNPTSPLFQDHIANTPDANEEVDGTNGSWPLYSCPLHWKGFADRTSHQRRQGLALSGLWREMFLRIEIIRFSSLSL